MAGPVPMIQRQAREGRKYAIEWSEGPRHALAPRLKPVTSESGDASRLFLRHLASTTVAHIRRR